MQQLVMELQRKPCWESRDSLIQALLYSMHAILLWVCQMLALKQRTEGNWFISEVQKTWREVEKRDRQVEGPGEEGAVKPATKVCDGALPGRA